MRDKRTTCPFHVNWRGAGRHRVGYYRRLNCFGCSRARTGLRSLNQQARQGGVDELAVERLLARSLPVRVTTRAERQEAVRILDGRKLSASQIAIRTGMSARTVVRLRGRNRVA